MKKLTTAGVCVVLMCSSALMAQASSAAAEPPSRPLPITVDQYDALSALAAQPQHAASLDVRASYSQSVYNKLQEPSSYITYAVIAGTILALVIAGAPY